MIKTALITGITGQDGAYLARLLLDKGYAVHGLMRRSSGDNLTRLRALCEMGMGPADEGPADNGPINCITLHDGDMTDALSVMRVIAHTKPDEVYNLAAQSDVAVSFATPEYTAQVNALGVVRLLEAVRQCGLTTHTRIYQAGTSELFGKVAEIPQQETTPFYPRSPYAIAKLYAHWTIINYRESYGMYAVNGILFNHESPHRGNNFVTKKIVVGLKRWAAGDHAPLKLGNLDAQRDWGYAPEYVEAMWRLLQLPTPQDLVIATGTIMTVREFATVTAEELGISLIWEGSNDTGYARDAKTDKIVIMVDPTLYRPAEVDILCGNATRAREILNWQPHITGRALIQRMIAEQ